MITHRQALEAAKTLSEYCDTRESCNDGDCIFCDVQDVCLTYSMRDNEMRIITKETERLERKEQDNDSVQG